MVKLERVQLDKNTFLTTYEKDNKLRWMVSVSNVGSCGSAVALSNIAEAVRARGVCSSEAMENLINHFAPVEIAAGEQLELF